MESEIRFVGKRGGDSDEDEFMRVDQDDEDFEFGKITRVDSQFDEFWVQNSRSSVVGYQQQLRAAEELDKKA